MSAPPLVWQSIFVRARREDVHPLLVDVPAYAGWWPGMQVQASGSAADLRWRRGLAGQRLRVRVAGTRPLRGVALTLEGALAGSAEWYYLDEAFGVVVSYLLHASTAGPGASRRVRAHHRMIRAGLSGLKHLLEGGRAVGAEHDPTLLAGLREDRARPGAPLAETAS